jgi:hypothetical protein
MWRGGLLVWVVVVFEELGKTIEMMLTDDRGEEEGTRPRSRETF